MILLTYDEWFEQRSTQAAINYFNDTEFLTVNREKVLKTHIENWIEAYGEINSLYYYSQKNTLHFDKRLHQQYSLKDKNLSETSGVVDIYNTNTIKGIIDNKFQLGLEGYHNSLNSPEHFELLKAYGFEILPILAQSSLDICIRQNNPLLFAYFCDYLEISNFSDKKDNSLRMLENNIEHNSFVKNLAKGLVRSYNNDIHETIFHHKEFKDYQVKFAEHIFLWSLAFPETYELAFELLDKQNKPFEFIESIKDLLNSNTNNLIYEKYSFRRRGIHLGTNEQLIDSVEKVENSLKIYHKLKNIPEKMKTNKKKI